MESAVINAHLRYGDTICVGPKTVIACGPEAVQRVLGYGQNHLDKSPDYDALVIHTPSIFSETDKIAHARKRRLAAHAYSMQTVVKLEAVVRNNLDQFLDKMNLYASTGEAMEASTWFKFYAFDVIGDLAFGKSFGLMQKGVVDEFVTRISEGIEYTFVVGEPFP